MLTMLEIGIYTELAIGTNKRRQHGHSPQNSVPVGEKAGKSVITQNTRKEVSMIY